MENIVLQIRIPVLKCQSHDQQQLKAAQFYLPVASRPTFREQREEKRSSLFQKKIYFALNAFAILLYAAVFANKETTAPYFVPTHCFSSIVSLIFACSATHQARRRIDASKPGTPFRGMAITEARLFVPCSFHVRCTVKSVPRDEKKSN